MIVNGIAEGCWVVKRTSGSVYEVDIDNSTLARRPTPHCGAESPAPRRGRRPITGDRRANRRDPRDLPCGPGRFRRGLHNTPHRHCVEPRSARPGVGNSPLTGEFKGVTGMWGYELRSRTDPRERILTSAHEMCTRKRRRN